MGAEYVPFLHCDRGDHCRERHGYGRIIGADRGHGFKEESTQRLTDESEIKEVEHGHSGVRGEGEEGHFAR